MAGAPGSGKTTIARALSNRLDGVAVNVDVVKSAVLNGGVDWRLAGPAAYEVLFALAHDLLAQGATVVVDSPCHYPEVLDRGQRVASASGATYRFVECVCTDIDELTRRIIERKPLRSQMRSLDEAPADAKGVFTAKRIGIHQWETFRPETEYLRIDTSRPLDSCLIQVFSYCGVQIAAPTVTER
jgi:predicted kinase